MTLRSLTKIVIDFNCNIMNCCYCVIASNKLLERSHSWSSRSRNHQIIIEFIIVYICCSCNEESSLIECVWRNLCVVYILYIQAVGFAVVNWRSCHFDCFVWHCVENLNCWFFGVVLTSFVQFNTLEDQGTSLQTDTIMETISNKMESPSSILSWNNFDISSEMANSSSCI